MSRSKHIMRQRQLAKRIEHNAMRVGNAPTKSVLSDAEWLAQNYAPSQESYTRLSMADLTAREDYRRFQEMCDEEEINIVPDPLGRTGTHEPKSIYSPAPPTRLKVDRGNIRKYKPHVPEPY